MTKLADAFDHGKAFVAFLTCGDPDLETTRKAVCAMEQAGADLIELGIPFSDPTAEGPVIQAANLRALKQGITTDDVFRLVLQLRQVDGVHIPMAFMTYANVVYHYGTEKFCAMCARTGIQGLILPDVPYEEKAEFDLVCRRYGLDLVSLIAPTSQGRIRTIAKDAQGFLYCVSSLGVTGMRRQITTDVQAMVQLVKESNPTIPAAVGFGIATPEQAKAMAAVSDGVIVGSAIVNLLAQHGRDAAPYVADYVRQMKDAIR